MFNVNKNKSSLFLMEIIVVTLFFTIGAVICIKIFWEGQKLSAKSSELTNATIEVQNAAQLIKHGRGDVSEIISYYGVTENHGETVVYFDEDFNACQKENGKYYMTISVDGEDLLSYNISYKGINSEEDIFGINSVIYKEAER